jgi:hypothetical protein
VIAATGIPESAGLERRCSAARHEIRALLSEDARLDTATLCRRGDVVSLAKTGRSVVATA